MTGSDTLRGLPDELAAPSCASPSPGDDDGFSARAAPGPVERGGDERRRQGFRQANEGKIDGPMARAGRIRHITGMHSARRRRDQMRSTRRCIGRGRIDADLLSPGQAVAGRQDHPRCDDNARTGAPAFGEHHHQALPDCAFGRVAADDGPGGGARNEHAEDQRRREAGASGKSSAAISMPWRTDRVKASLHR